VSYACEIMSLVKCGVQQINSIEAIYCNRSISHIEIDPKWLVLVPQPFACATDKLNLKI
jgi:hypothetical protein